MPVTMTGSLGGVRWVGREHAKNGDYGDWGMSLMDMYISVYARSVFLAACETRKQGVATPSVNRTLLQGLVFFI